MLIPGFGVDTMTHDQIMAKTNKHVGSSGTSLIKMPYVEKISRICKLLQPYNYTFINK